MLQPLEDQALNSLDAPAAPHRPARSAILASSGEERLDLLGFDPSRYGVVVTGEGRVDATTGAGKAVDEVRRRYRTLVLQNHPDRLIARGMPEEFIAIATRRLAAINVAFEAIEQTLARV